MTNVSLAQSYLVKARVRPRILPVLFDAQAEQYDAATARRAIDDAEFAVLVAARVIAP